MHHKTLLFVGGVVLGIVAGEASLVSTEIALGAIFLFFIQLAIAMIYKSNSRAAVLTAVLSFGIFIGVVRVQLVEEKVPYACTTTCTFEARIARSPELKNGYQELIVRARDADARTLDILIRAPLYPLYHVGDSVRLTGLVREPEILFPHGEKKVFDYPNFLRTKSVGSEMLYPKIEMIDSASLSVGERLGRLKESMIEKIELHVSSPASSLASGMLFGNSSMPKSLTETFRAAGLSHIVVLSGFNIAIVIAFVLILLGFLPLVLRTFAVCAFVVMFVLMVGGEPSVVRASFMACIALAATSFGREYVAKQALIISFLVIILYEPFALMHDVSLHLSFLATAGIVYGSGGVSTMIKKYIGEKLLPLFTTTIAAYVATFPYVSYMFGTVSLYSLLANVLVVPLVPLAMLLSFSVVVSSYLSHTAALVFGFVDTALINLMIFIAERIEALPFSYLHFSASLPLMCILYATIGIIFVWTHHRTKNETRQTNERGMLTDVIAY